MTVSLHIAGLRIDPPLLAAPMAGFSNDAFRSLVRRWGGAAVYQTAQCAGLQAIEARGEERPDRLWGVNTEPQPLGIQLWDNNGGAMAAAGKPVNGYGC